MTDLQEYKTTLHLFFSTNFGYSAIIYQENPFLIIKILLPYPDKKKRCESVAGNYRSKPGQNQMAIIISKNIIDYFKGKSDSIQAPPWKWMDTSRLTKLQKYVLNATADIPYGELRSYKEIAADIGRPRACRFVGTTLANNRFPILVPCHRVIRSNSTVGRFGGGVDLKKKLIEFEARHSSDLHFPAPRRLPENSNFFFKSRHF